MIPSGSPCVQLQCDFGKALISRFQVLFDAAISVLSQIGYLARSSKYVSLAGFSPTASSSTLSRRRLRIMKETQTIPYRRDIIESITVSCVYTCMHAWQHHHGFPSLSVNACLEPTPLGNKLSRRRDVERLLSVFVQIHPPSILRFGGAEGTEAFCLCRSSIMFCRTSSVRLGM